ncbi:hypothetical protein IR083_00825 [Dysgonomonas sp. GY75]|jgi:hypothetical protein|uniref:hypothetical protein n=1 Tax=Dysgonomonas sp. GY75 TaxID=2780419 RepID=UPI001883329B|nr:hypothetical protein [Dysgonomonas sp. GY75]MBF0647362.1 hypothetical protein [Dysgonomonas sp. GY75]
MENKDKPGGKALRGRSKKKKEKLSCSLNLKLTEKDFNSVKENTEKFGMRVRDKILIEEEYLTRAKVKW